MTTVLTGEVLRRLYAHDASHYVLYPSDVRLARTVADVASIFASARESGSSVTFRSGGTSLSGQGVGGGILVDTRRGFQKVRILDDGAIVECEPGATVAYVNAVLRRRWRSLGPDPASETAATIGGVLANNSSGMACGTEFNTYNLLDSLVVTLPSGTTIDTADQDADEQLRIKEPHIFSTLERIRDEIRGDQELVRLIEHHFSMKNTIGYGLNSFLDFDTPIDILTHLLVGSEGTLGFVSKIRMRTVEVHRLKADGLAVFETLEAAAQTIEGLRNAGAHTIELMDATSLRVAQSLAGTPDDIMGLNVDEHCALLIECRAHTEEELEAGISAVSAVLDDDGVPTEFFTDPVRCASLWSVRKGLYAACAGSRDTGTTALLEDIVVPVQVLAETCRGLQELTTRFGYQNSVIFGHAKDGNLHFMITDDFTVQSGLDKLEEFTEALVDLVLSKNGNLKAEHGTGRAMAPFVERQYGTRLYEIMWQFKQAIDPILILNPGVILDRDLSSHLSNMKTYPAPDPIVDRCVECGYCEPHCPSRELTLTPRTRIVLEREIMLAKERGDSGLVAELESVYDYSVLDTCAVDGMCGGACPLGINTGDLVRSRRATQNSSLWQAIWKRSASTWSGFTKLAGTALNIASRLPVTPLSGLSRIARGVLGSDRIPQYTRDIPSGGVTRRRPQVSDKPADAVYFPSCLGSLFDAEGNVLEDDLLYLAHQAGLNLVVPSGIDSLCCGTPWSSKGMTDGYAVMKQKVITALAELTEHGTLPVVCDASSCTEGLIKAVKDAGITVIDAPRFVTTDILPRLDLPPASTESITIHPTCSTNHLGTTPDVVTIASAVSSDVHVPDGWGCCGFAGDRGMLHPELTASATKREADEVRSIGADIHVSSNRTCEIGMSRATGETYQSLISVLAKHLRRN